MATNLDSTTAARASEPACSAAIFFTAKGARNVADLCLPVFDVVDRMYPQLIKTGWLEAFLVTPALLYQDKHYASNIAFPRERGREREGVRERETWAHAPRAHGQRRSDIDLCLCECVHACVRACVRAFGRACVRS